jgi:hypothetical protein
MERRAPRRRQGSDDVVALERVAPEVVVLALAVDVLHVERVRQSQCLVGRSVRPRGTPGPVTTSGTWMSLSKAVSLPGVRRCWPMCRPLSELNTTLSCGRRPVRIDAREGQQSESVTK